VALIGLRRHDQGHDPGQEIVSLRDTGSIARELPVTVVERRVLVVVLVRRDPVVIGTTQVTGALQNNVKLWAGPCPARRMRKRIKELKKANDIPGVRIWSRVVEHLLALRKEGTSPGGGVIPSIRGLVTRAALVSTSLHCRPLLGRASVTLHFWR
jgi:hypothetical protein